MRSSNSAGPSPEKRVAKLPTLEQILHGDSGETNHKQAPIEPAPVPEGVVALPGFDNMTRFHRKRQKDEAERVRVLAAALEPQAGEQQPPEELEQPPENAQQNDILQDAAPAQGTPEELRKKVMGELEQERERILKEAEAERRRILDEATLEAIHMRDSIRQEEEQRAKEESREQIQEIVGVLRQAIRAFQNEKDSMFELVEQKLMDVTIAIMDLVFRQEITYNKGAYGAIIKAALSELESDHASKLYTSPEAYDVVMHEPDCAPIVERLNEIGMEIVRDATVPEGDVLVRSAESTLQYGTATMIKRITERIKEQLER